MFPERFSVEHFPFVTGGTDSQGNPKDDWAEIPIIRRVVTVYPPSADEAIRDEQSGVDRDLDVITLTRWGGPRDKVIVGGVAYFVVGYPNDYTHHPWGFPGGYRLKLKRVEG